MKLLGQASFFFSCKWHDGLPKEGQDNYSCNTCLSSVYQDCLDRVVFPQTNWKHIGLFLNATNAEHCNFYLQFGLLLQTTLANKLSFLLINYHSFTLLFICVIDLHALLIRLELWHVFIVFHKAFTWQRHFCSRSDGNIQEAPQFTEDVSSISFSLLRNTMWLNRS